MILLFDCFHFGFFAGILGFDIFFNAFLLVFILFLPRWWLRTVLTLFLFLLVLRFAFILLLPMLKFGLFLRLAFRITWSFLFFLWFRFRLDFHLLFAFSAFVFFGSCGWASFVMIFLPFLLWFFLGFWFLWLIVTRLSFAFRDLVFYLFLILRYLLILSLNFNCHVLFFRFIICIRSLFFWAVS